MFGFCKNSKWLEICYASRKNRQSSAPKDPTAYFLQYTESESSFAKGLISTKIVPYCDENSVRQGKFQAPVGILSQQKSEVAATVGRSRVSSNSKTTWFDRDSDLPLSARATSKPSEGFLLTFLSTSLIFTNILDAVMMTETPAAQWVRSLRARHRKFG